MDEKKYQWWMFIDSVGRKLRDEYLKQNGSNVGEKEVNQYLKVKSGEIDHEISLSKEKALEYLSAFDCQDKEEIIKLLVKQEIQKQIEGSFKGFLKHSVDEKS